MDTHVAHIAKILVDCCYIGTSSHHLSLLKDLSNMYIKLLLERLFKDLFLETNVNYCYFLQLCAYNLYLKHKVVFKPKLCVIYLLAIMKKKKAYMPYITNI